MPIILLKILFGVEKHKIGKKRSKMTAQLPKPIENPNIVDMKSVIMEHPKT